jgi:hypothetical protein
MTDASASLSAVVTEQPQRLQAARPGPAYQASKSRLQVASTAPARPGQARPATPWHCGRCKRVRVSAPRSPGPGPPAAWARCGGLPSQVQVASDSAGPPAAAAGPSGGISARARASVTSQSQQSQHSVNSLADSHVASDLTRDSVRRRPGAGGAPRQAPR